MQNGIIASTQILSQDTRIVDLVLKNASSHPKCKDNIPDKMSQIAFISLFLFVFFTTDLDCNFFL